MDALHTEPALQCVRKLLNVPILTAPCQLFRTTGQSYILWKLVLWKSRLICVQIQLHIVQIT